ncbi:MAG: hypothetical protein LUF30_12565 [Lachnospiraceae bacterium]|nr:hypothetical protein [Lachnospiraceae bacterium]
MNLEIASKQKKTGGKVMQDLNEDKKDVCPFCGKAWVEGDRYCRHCGAKKNYPEPEKPTQVIYGPAWVFRDRNQ